MIIPTLKKMLTITKKNKYTYSADGKQFNFNSIKNLFIIASNPRTTKDEVKIFLKKTIATEMQKINKTNCRGQNKEKYFMLDVYKNISTLFGPLVKLNDEQPDTRHYRYAWIRKWRVCWAK